MRKLLVLAAMIALSLAPVLAQNHTDEVVFKTVEPAPVGFDQWTFFWVTPAIEPDATLEYIVIQPDGGEYFRMGMGTPQPGKAIRSDFGKSLDGRDPSVFYGRQIVFKFRVTKGRIRFEMSPNIPRFPAYQFEFRKMIKGVVEQN